MPGPEKPNDVCCSSSGLLWESSSSATTGKTVGGRRWPGLLRSVWLGLALGLLSLGPASASLLAAAFALRVRWLWSVAAAACGYACRGFVDPYLDAAGWKVLNSIDIPRLFGSEPSILHQLHWYNSISAAVLLAAPIGLVAITAAEHFILKRNAIRSQADRAIPPSQRNSNAIVPLAQIPLVSDRTPLQAPASQLQASYPSALLSPVKPPPPVPPPILPTPREEFAVVGDVDRAGATAGGCELEEPTLQIVLPVEQPPADDAPLATTPSQTRRPTQKVRTMVLDIFRLPGLNAAGQGSNPPIVPENAQELSCSPDSIQPWGQSNEVKLRLDSGQPLERLLRRLSDRAEKRAKSESRAGKNRDE